jgi:phage FluMu protein Com
MQIRCQNCHKPYALNHEVVLQALDQLNEGGQGYYNAACPHCGRMNKISKEVLLRAAPDWVKPAPEA